MKSYFLCIAFFLLIYQMSAIAQNQVPSDVLGSGGTRGTSSQNQLMGTLGQAFVGKALGSNNQVAIGFWNQVPDMLVAVDPLPGNNLPRQFRLDQNYPNPFNPSTTISFNLPQGSPVTLQVYNIAGQEVRTLINREMTAGQHRVVWDGRNDVGLQVVSGVYLYRLIAGEHTAVQKMILLR